MNKSNKCIVVSYHEKTGNCTAHVRRWDCKTGYHQYNDVKVYRKTYCVIKNKVYKINNILFMAIDRNADMSTALKLINSYLQRKYKSEINKLHERLDFVQGELCSLKLDGLSCKMYTNTKDGVEHTLISIK